MPIKPEEGFKGLQPGLKLHAMLYGPPGSGKTRLAATIPGRKLWLDYDDGMKSLDANPDIIRVGPEQLKKHADTLECLTDTYRLVKADAIILDTASTLYRIEVEDYLNMSSKHAIPTLAEYGPAAERTRQLLRYALALPVHVIICAHRQAFKDEVRQIVIGGPNVPGKLIDDAPGMVDELYYMTMVNNPTAKKEEVRICTKDDGIWPAKTRIGGEIFDKYEKPDLAYLIDKAIRMRCKSA